MFCRFTNWLVCVIGFAVLCKWYSLHTVRLKYFPSAIRPFVMGFLHWFLIACRKYWQEKNMYSIEEQSIKAISTIAWSQIDRLLMAIFIVLGLVVNLLITFLPFSFCHHIPIGFLYATTWSIHFIRKIWPDHFWCRFQHIGFVSAWITAIMEESFKFTRLSHSIGESEHNAKQYSQGKCQSLFHSRIQSYWSNEFYFYIRFFSCSLSFRNLSIVSKICNEFTKWIGKYGRRNWIWWIFNLLTENWIATEMKGNCNEKYEIKIWFDADFQI